MKLLATWSAWIGRLAFTCLMCAGVWMMLSASASYVELGDEHPFFLEKLPLAYPTLWQTALYVHVPSALFSLPACLVLLVQRIRTRFPKFHRWLGRITGALVLFAVVPSGMYLAFFAQGGLITTLGFWLTGLVAFVAMLKSIERARAGDIKAHRRFSTHVAAQLSVAVFSRFLLVGAEQAELYSTWVYVASLWIPVIACAFVAERMAGPRSPSRMARMKGSRHEELVVVSPLDAVRESLDDRGARRAARAT
jgi:uncharacterized membrane protein